MNIEELEVSPQIIKALKAMGFESLTPVQEMTIPAMIKGNDIIAQAPTGTGKTCAYAIPAIDNIDMNDDSVQILVMCPTRELAVQSVEEIKRVCAFKENIRTIAIYGGQAISRQIMGLKKRPQIVVGTPGRIIDHIERSTLKLKNVRVLVLDEADEMLNMGFREDIDRILESVSTDHQTVLFSATMPKAIKDISKRYQRDNVVSIKTNRDKEIKQLIKQFYILIKESDKTAVLVRLLDTLDYRLVLVFCRTKRGVDELNATLQDNGYQSEALHGDLKQAQRDKVMMQFRKGTVNVLIATDVAARGLDIENVDIVINYDLTDVDEYYLHRIGRTGRANKEGEAYTFLTRRQNSMIRVYEELTKATIKEYIPLAAAKGKEKKQMQYLEKIKTILTEDLKEYEQVIDSLVATTNVDETNPITPLQVAAALLKLATFKETKAIRPITESKPFERRNGEGNKRFFINLGEKDGLSKRKMQQVICEFVGVNENHFGDIYIKDTYAFFELPESFADAVVKNLDGQYYQERLIAVELADQGDRGGESRQNRGESGGGRSSGGKTYQKPSNFSKPSPGGREFGAVPPRGDYANKDRSSYGSHSSSRSDSKPYQQDKTSRYSDADRPTKSRGRSEGDARSRTGRRNFF